MTSFDWHVAMRPQPGQSVSGDDYLVAPFEGGTLLGVIDGLGHGEKAAHASETAVKALIKKPDDPPVALIEYTHRLTRQTRGNVISIASVKDSGAMTWIGVGNVTAVIVRQQPGEKGSREYLLLRGGVVGYRLPSLRPFTITINAGDTLIFASDGVRSGFTDSIPLNDPPKQIAEYILQTFGRDTDDATVLVARYTNST